MTDLTTALATFRPVDQPGIADAELLARIATLQGRMVQDGVAGVWLDASTSLRYFTGMALGQSERIHGALVPAHGPLTYISPTFERPKLQT